ncbi:hypothetical protein RHS02_06757, partial [Rhizoctonia solani]
MNGNMNTLFVHGGRSLRIHFDSTRITALAIRQLSWTVEQAGGAIVDQPSNADVLVVDPAAPWVFQDFLKPRRPELRPSVVLAFWIPLCLTTRSLVWVNHAHWEQVVIPSERSPRSGVPQGITAYSSFLAGITYGKNAPPPTKAVPRSSIVRERDSSVVSHLDNSDLEVSQSLEPGVLSDNESVVPLRKSSHPVVLEKKSWTSLPPIDPSHERPTEKDEDEVSRILPVCDDSLPLEDVNMPPASPISGSAQQCLMESALRNVAPSSSSASLTEPAKKPPPTIPEAPITQSQNSPHPSPSRKDIPQPPAASPLTPATVTVESGTLDQPNSIQLAGAEPPTVPPRSLTGPTAQSPETVANAKEARVSPALDSSSFPVSKHPNSVPLELSSHNSNVTKDETLADANVTSNERSEPTIVAQPSDPPNGLSRTRAVLPNETNTHSKPAEPTTSAASSVETPSTKRRASASNTPNNPASALKTSATTGLRYIPEQSSGIQSSKASPSNLARVKRKHKIRPAPQEENDSVASTSSPRASLPKSKLNIQSSPNGTNGKPRPSTVAKTNKVAPPVKSSQKSSLARSPESSTGPFSASLIPTPARATTTDTPHTAPGSTLSRPKEMIVRAKTTSTKNPTQQITLVPPVLKREPASVDGSEDDDDDDDEDDDEDDEDEDGSGGDSDNDKGEDGHTNGDGNSDGDEVKDKYEDEDEVVVIDNPPPRPPVPTLEQQAALDAKRPAWTKEEDRYIIDYMNWVFAQDPSASTSEIMREIAANVSFCTLFGILLRLVGRFNTVLHRMSSPLSSSTNGTLQCPYRPANNWQKRFSSKEDSIYMNEVPILFERLTNKTSGGSSSRNRNKTLEILSGTRTRAGNTRGPRTSDIVVLSDDESTSGDDGGYSPPRKRSRYSRSSARRRSDRLG